MPARSRIPDAEPHRHPRLTPRRSPAAPFAKFTGRARSSGLACSQVSSVLRSVPGDVVDLLVISPNFLAGLVIVSLVAWGVAVWRGQTAALGECRRVQRAGRRAVARDGRRFRQRALRVPAARGRRARRAHLADRQPGATSSGRPTAAPQHPRGAVVSVRLPGTESGFGDPAAMVYFPPQYFTEPTRRFPVVYLLHGSPGAPIDWFRAARASDAGLCGRPRRPSGDPGGAAGQPQLDRRFRVRRPAERTHRHLRREGRRARASTPASAPSPREQRGPSPAIRPAATAP